MNIKTVRDLIEVLNTYNPELSIVVCADNGDDDAPGDLTAANIIRVGNDGPADRDAVIALWLPMGTTINVK